MDLVYPLQLSKTFSTKKSHITSIPCFTFGFMSRVIVSNNVLISNIYNSPCRLYSNIWSWWDSLLHMSD